MSARDAAEFTLIKLAEVNGAVGVGTLLSQEECADPKVTAFLSGESQQVQSMAICMLTPSSRDAGGLTDMKFFEVISLELKSGTVISNQSGVTDLRVVEGSIETFPTGPIDGQLNFDKIRATEMVKAALARVIEGDYGAFECKLAASELAGLGTDEKSMPGGHPNSRVRTGASSGRPNDSPWLQLDGYRRKLRESGSRPAEKGAKLPTSVVLLGARVRPFIGLPKYDVPLDPQAGSRGGSRKELMQFGISLERKF